MIEVLNSLRDLLGSDLLDFYHDRYGRYYLLTKAERMLDVVGLIVKFDGRFIALSANDIGTLGFELIYHFDFSGFGEPRVLSVKVRVPRENPIIKSIVNIVEAANWAEREIMELMGVKFEGHPDPRRLFLPYAWPREEVA